jgi:hypothetical protein
MGCACHSLDAATGVANEQETDEVARDLAPCCDALEAVRTWQEYTGGKFKLSAVWRKTRENNGMRGPRLYEIEGISKTADEWAADPDCHSTAGSIRIRWARGKRTKEDLFSSFRPSR